MCKSRFKGNSDIDIALLVQGNRTDSWKYNDKSDELEKTRIEIFCDCKFCSPSL